jgi:hypothetical protein
MIATVPAAGIILPTVAETATARTDWSMSWRSTLVAAVAVAATMEAPSNPTGPSRRANAVIADETKLVITLALRTAREHAVAIVTPPEAIATRAVFAVAATAVAIGATKSLRDAVPIAVAPSSAAALAASATGPPHCTAAMSVAAAAPRSCFPFATKRGAALSTPATEPSMSLALFTEAEASAPMLTALGISSFAFATMRLAAPNADVTTATTLVDIATIATGALADSVASPLTETYARKNATEYPVPAGSVDGSLYLAPKPFDQG